MRSVTSNSSPLVRTCPPLWSGSLVPWSRCRSRALSYLPLSRARIGTSVFRFCLLVSASSSVCSDMRASTPYTRPATPPRRDTAQPLGAGPRVDRALQVGDRALGAAHVLHAAHVGH